MDDLLEHCHDISVITGLFDTACDQSTGDWILQRGSKGSVAL